MEGKSTEGPGVAAAEPALAHAAHAWEERCAARGRGAPYPALDDGWLDEWAEGLLKAYVSVRPKARLVDVNHPNVAGWAVLRRADVEREISEAAGRPATTDEVDETCRIVGDLAPGLRGHAVWALREALAVLEAEGWPKTPHNDEWEDPDEHIVTFDVVATIPGWYAAAGTHNPEDDTWTFAASTDDLLRQYNALRPSRQVVDFASPDIIDSVVVDNEMVGDEIDDYMGRYGASDETWESIYAGLKTGSLTTTGDSLSAHLQSRARQEAGEAFDLLLKQARLLARKNPSWHLVESCDTGAILHDPQNWLTPYVAAVGYDPETNDWSQGSYYATLLDAYNSAHRAHLIDIEGPEVVAESVFTRKDVADKIVAWGSQPTRELIDEVARECRDDASERMDEAGSDWLDEIVREALARRGALGGEAAPALSESCEQARRAAAARPAGPRSASKGA